MIGRVLGFVSGAALAFVVTRAWLARDSRPTQHAPAPPPGEVVDVGDAPSRGPAPTIARAPSVTLAHEPPTPWQEHLLRDPEHHLPDQQRIFDALFDSGTARALHACEPLLPPVETKVRLRTSARVDASGIRLADWQFHTILDGADLDDAARACVTAALPADVVVTPTHPEHIGSFTGPFDFDISVSGTKE